MKLCVFLAALLFPPLLAQNHVSGSTPQSITSGPPEFDRFPHDRVLAFKRQMERDRIDIFASTQVAEKLLLKKVTPVFKNPPMSAKVTGTVVVAFEIDKSGNVLHPMVFSGPALLRQPVLEAVRNYRYQPYLLNGEPVVVATHVSVTCSNE